MLTSRPATSVQRHHACCSRVLAQPISQLFRAQRCNKVGSRAQVGHGESSTSAAQQAGLEPSRPVALPNGMWLLDIWEDQWYDIRGPNFVIQRAENQAPSSSLRPRRVVKGPITPANKTMGLVHKVIWNHPGSVMMLEGAVVDVSDFLEDIEDNKNVPKEQDIQPNNSCKGIVMVQQVPTEEEEGVEASDSEKQDVFYTTSSSTRRTKMVGFTCKCCGARNFNSVNPQSFLSGTLVAQCKKCTRWHKISDHFKLFHDLKGPLFHKKATKQEMDDVVPPALRLDPLLWDDEDFMAGQHE